MLGFTVEGHRMKLVHYTVVIFLLLCLVFGIGVVYAVAAYATVVVAYSSIRIWLMRVKPNEPSAGLMAHCAFAIGTAIGIPLFALLVLICNIPNCRQLKITLQKWIGDDRQYEIVES